MIYLKLFEDFKPSKFTIEDMEKCNRDSIPVFSDSVKDKKNHKPEDELMVVDINKETNEIGVTQGDSNDIYYVDLEDINKLGTSES